MSWVTDGTVVLTLSLGYRWNATLHDVFGYRWKVSPIIALGYRWNATLHNVFGYRWKVSPIIALGYRWNISPPWMSLVTEGMYWVTDGIVDDRLTKLGILLLDQWQNSACSYPTCKNSSLNHQFQLYPVLSLLYSNNKWLIRLKWDQYLHRYLHKYILFISLPICDSHLVVINPYTPQD